MWEDPDDIGRHLSVVTVGGQVRGHLSWGGGGWELYGEADGPIRVVREPEHGECGNGGVLDAVPKVEDDGQPSALLAPSLQAANGSAVLGTLDLMAVVNQDTLNAKFAGDLDALDLEMLDATAEMQEAFDRNAIRHRVRYLGSRVVTFPVASPPDLCSDRFSLRTSPTVQAARDDYGADVVIGVVSEPEQNAGGCAFQPQNDNDGFVAWKGHAVLAAEDLSILRHEVGHNLGIGHDFDATKAGDPVCSGNISPYACGYSLLYGGGPNSAPGEQACSCLEDDSCDPQAPPTGCYMAKPRRDIMSKVEAEEVGVYSDPCVWHRGCGVGVVGGGACAQWKGESAPVGTERANQVENQANARRFIVENIAQVEAYRPAVAAFDGVQLNQTPFAGDVVTNPFLLQWNPMGASLHEVSVGYPDTDRDGVDETWGPETTVYSDQAWIIWNTTKPLVRVRIRSLIWFGTNTPEQRWVTSELFFNHADVVRGCNEEADAFLPDASYANVSCQSGAWKWCDVAAGTSELFCDIEGPGNYPVAATAIGQPGGWGGHYDYRVWGIGSNNQKFCCLYEGRLAPIHKLSLIGTEAPDVLKLREGTRYLHPPTGVALEGYVSAAGGNDQIYGSDEDVADYLDRLFGRRGVDQTYAGRGADFLRGGRDLDVQWG
jgi:hypothetical protein